MPELPEVETVMRGMEGAMLSQSICSVKVNRYDLRVAVPVDLGQVMTGANVVSFERRGKYIIMHTDRDVAVVIHLGMSGRIRIFSSSTSYEARKHDHIIMCMGNDACVAFEDPRRFGMFYYVSQTQWQKMKPFSVMGPEPLGVWRAEQLFEALSARKSPIKNALLDQAVVAGLGNIYVCEALYTAGVSPVRRACDVTMREAEDLVPIIKAILEEAIKAGGSTLKDYQHTDGSLGYFQHRFKVYDQEGADCSLSSCHGVIERMVQSGRSSFYCPECQS